ncbi:uncharacterized protein K02A2.6-like [Solenopsis invicta]|uniref:uncharacterized protein K02A2.6-like n=1 Tax=Solenopsis invicta TaxID=13686 RepID=UPI00193E24F0|nr:uncharacterized protein K02A2.6-like [Solenopsis invicta]
MKGVCIVIPKALRGEALRALHLGHQGFTKCYEQAKYSIWCPGITHDLRQIIEQCRTCAEHRSTRPEPLLPAKFPDRPWEIIAMDLFKFENSWYLLNADYYSRYPELYKLQSMQSSEIIKCLQDSFARHGIPEIIRSDNRPQFNPIKTRQFMEFKEKMNFRHITSSPHYPQSNGFIESMVKVMKKGLSKSQNANIFLMEYRATPLECGFSPSELLMGRRIKTLLPVYSEVLLPKLIERKIIMQKEYNHIQRQKRNFDSKHYTTENAPLAVGDELPPTAINIMEDAKPTGQIQNEKDEIEELNNKKNDTTEEDTNTQQGEDQLPSRNELQPKETPDQIITKRNRKQTTFYQSEDFRTKTKPKKGGCGSTGNLERYESRQRAL